jgi:signal transduction histidine kinase
LHGEVAQLRGELEERNRALASSLAENERMRIALRQILDALPCGVAVVEVPTERVVLLNPEGARLLDVQGGESLFGNDLPAWMQTAILAAWREPREHGYEQEVSVEKNGQQRWLAIRYSRMPSAAAVAVADETELTSVILIVRDITEHKHAELDREAARNVVALAEISTVLAHEIRNPLGSLELLTRCVAEDPGLNEESKQCVEHLQAGVRSLSATVSNVLRFHTPGSAPLRPLELASVIRNGVEFVRPLAKQKNVGLALREKFDQAQIAGDSEELKQVMLNLLCNALRHTQSGGEVTVTSKMELRKSGWIAVIEFADTGHGIAADALPKIFEPGYSTTGSSGLGLAVCRHIVEQHGGNITAQSEVGKGATFQVEIPVL